MANYELIVVDAANWVTAVTERKDQGFGYLDFLSVRQLESGDHVLSVHLINLDNFDRVILESSWPKPDTAESMAPLASLQIPSLTTIFPGASWHELEASELFGIAFVAGLAARSDLARSNLAMSDLGAGEPFISAVPALRRDFVLQPRVENPWPGVHEPGLEPDHPRLKRRRSVPGNPASWEAAND